MTFNYFNIKFIQTSLTPLLKTTEVCFAGRSNVGKSSLINSLGNYQIANISRKPGKTKFLNYYLLQKHNIYFVDLPGYGYNNWSKKENMQIENIMTNYFFNNPKLKLIIMLIDGRRHIQDLDIKMWSLIQKLQKKYLILVSKYDLLTQKEKYNLIFNYQKKISFNNNNFILFSNKTKYNINKIINKILVNCK